MGRQPQVLQHSTPHGPPPPKRRVRPTDAGAARMTPSFTVLVCPFSDASNEQKVWSRHSLLLSISILITTNNNNRYTLKNRKYNQKYRSTSCQNQQHQEIVLMASRRLTALEWDGCLARMLSSRVLLGKSDLPVQL